jgi:hypothetical protein
MINGRSRRYDQTIERYVIVPENICGGGDRRKFDGCGHIPEPQKNKQNWGSQNAGMGKDRRSERGLTGKERSFGPMQRWQRTFCAPNIPAAIGNG